MYREPIDTRTIMPRHNETVDYPCEYCEESPLKILRVEVETHKQTFENTYHIVVKLRCQCLFCGLKQAIQLVEMP